MPVTQRPKCETKRAGSLNPRGQAAVRHTVQHQRVEAGIGQHDLETRPRGRIARDDGVDFVAQVLEHASIRHDMIARFARPLPRRARESAGGQASDDVRSYKMS